MPSDRKVLTEWERVQKRRRVLDKVKQTDYYRVAKEKAANIAAKGKENVCMDQNSNNMNSNNLKMKPGPQLSPPVTPRNIEDMSKRDWERQFLYLQDQTT